MNKEDDSKSLNRPWQFYVGAACVGLSFLAIVIHYTNIFHPILFESEAPLDVATIQNGVREGMKFALWCLPIMLVGFVFIAVAVARNQLGGAQRK
jgi:hypothetical protein